MSNCHLVSLSSMNAGCNIINLLLVKNFIVLIFVRLMFRIFYLLKDE